jgi:secreted trypsin-like serine protease
MRTARRTTWVLLLCLQTVLSADRASAAPRMHNGHPQNGPGLGHVVLLSNTLAQRVCTGIAIDANWVLTAGHCARGAARAAALGTPATEVIGRYCHQGFEASRPPDRMNSRHDLALLRTHGTLHSPWKLSDVDSAPRQGLLLFAWSEDKILYRSSPMSLQDAVQGGVKMCETFWAADRQKIDAEEFCAGDGASSGCLGDSGGPLFSSAALEGQPAKLVGVLSKADAACGAGGIFDVYTAIDTIDTAWIKRVLAGHKPTLQQSEIRCNVPISSH